MANYLGTYLDRLFDALKKAPNRDIRALCIVCPITTSVPYCSALGLYFAGLPSLSESRDKLCRDFFQKMRYPSIACIHYLLPPRVTLNLLPGSEMLPHIVDVVTEPTVANRSSIML